MVPLYGNMEAMAVNILSLGIFLLPGGSLTAGDTFDRRRGVWV